MLSFIYKGVLAVAFFYTAIFIFSSDSFASHNIAQNIGNGNGSLNSATATSFENTTFDQRNSSIETNDSTTRAVSGDNTTDQNVDGGDITTGDAKASANIESVSNSNSISSLCACDNQENVAKNIGNGEMSTNLAVADSTKIRSFLQENRDRNNNNNVTIARSGRNRADNNTGGGKVKTGKSDTSTNIRRTRNSNTVNLLP